MKPLTANEKSVLRLFDKGFIQAGIFTLKVIKNQKGKPVSKPYINLITKKLESINLIYRNRPLFTYSLSAEAKSLLAGTVSANEYTPARVHNFKRKFKILSSTGTPSIDKRTNFEKSWNMRGGARHKFWFAGDAGIPSVTVDWHIKTLVVYIDKGQTLLAKSIKEAEGLGWAAIRKAKEKWSLLQHSFGIDFVVEEIGEPIGKLHAGFVMQDKDPVIKEVLENDGKVGYADYWVDKSVEKECGPGYVEAETAQQGNMTRLGKGIQIIESIQPEAFKDLNKLSGIDNTVSRVEAMLQGSITTAQQNENILKFLSKIMDEMAEIRKENRELKQKFGQQRLVL